MHEHVAEVTVVVGGRPAVAVRRHEHHVAVVREVAVREHAGGRERPARDADVATGAAACGTPCRVVVGHLGVGDAGKVAPRREALTDQVLARLRASELGGERRQEIARGGCSAGQSIRDRQAVGGNRPAERHGRAVQGAAVDVPAIAQLVGGSAIAAGGTVTGSQVRGPHLLEALRDLGNLLGRRAGDEAERHRDAGDLGHARWTHRSGTDHHALGCGGLARCQRRRGPLRHQRHGSGDGGDECDGSDGSVSGVDHGCGFRGWGSVGKRAPGCQGSSAIRTADNTRCTLVAVMRVGSDQESLRNREGLAGDVL